MSPFGGTGSTAALAFVLVVAGIKAVWEDVKRHQEDLKTNKSVAHLVNSDGESKRLCLLGKSIRHLLESISVSWCHIMR